MLTTHIWVWQSGSRITPAPYEKAQASDVICKRAAHPGSELNQKKCRVGRACVYDLASTYSKFSSTAESVDVAR